VNGKYKNKEREKHCGEWVKRCWEVGFIFCKQGPGSLKFSKNVFLRIYSDTNPNGMSIFSNCKIYIAMNSGQVTWQRSQGTLQTVHQYLWLRPAVGATRVQGEGEMARLEQVL
jgi:hypothetical protein